MKGWSIFFAFGLVSSFGGAIGGSDAATSFAVLLPARTASRSSLLASFSIFNARAALYSVCFVIAASLPGLLWAPLVLFLALLLDGGSEIASAFRSADVPLRPVGFRTWPGWIRLAFWAAPVSASIMGSRPAAIWSR